MAGLYDGALNDLVANDETAARAAQPGSTLAPPPAAPAVANPFDQGSGQAAPAPLPAPAPASLYDAAIDDVQREDGARLQGAIEIARKSDPDRYAEVSRIATRDGLPLDFVANNLDDLRSKATANDMRKVLEGDAAVRRWFETGDNANAVKHDDLHRLSGMNWLMQSTAAAWSEGWGQRQQADIRFRQMMGQATPDEIRLADKMDKQGARDYGSEGFFQGAPAALAAQLPNLIGSTAQGFERAAYGATLGTATGAAVGSAAGGVGAIPGAVLGFGAGTTAGLLTGRAEDNFRQEAGGAYGEFIRFRTDDGAAMDPAVARGAAVVAGVAAAGLETIGEAALERLIPGLDKVGVASLLRNGSREAIKEALQRPTVRAAFKAFGMNALKAGSTEIATEVAQEAVVLLGGELAKRADGGEFQQIEAGEVRSRLMDAATETAQAMLILTPALASPKFGADLRRARRSAEMSSLYETANQTAKDTELRQRDPGRYLNAIKSFLGDGKASDTVYVDTGKLTELFQEQGLSPSDLDARIDGFSGRYAEAVATGSQVHIDMADYATHIAGTPLGDALLEHQTWHPDNLTVAEANRALEEAREQQEALLEDAITSARDEAARRAPADQVAEKVYAQLVNIGESPETARTQAALAKAFFGATAERSGLDALELYEQQRLEIRRAMPDGLDYRKTDELDLALDAIRKGDAERAGRLRQRGRGASLSSFLAGKGGLVESDSFAGELNARDLKRFKSGRLIGKNGKGMNIDDASLAAAEAGYFPGYVDENGDIDRAGLVEAFLSSLDEEIAGRPVFTLDADAVQIDPQLARVEALAGELSALGLDTAAMSNEDIRAELMRATAQDAEQDALFQFAGAQSVQRFPTTSEQLNRAIDMEDGGAYPDEIWQETGFFRGVDGKWRIEIADTDAKLKEDAFVTADDGGDDYSGPLSGVLTHKDLFAAYPELKNLPIRIGIGGDKKSGVYFEGENRIEVDAPDLKSARSIVLHEVAHTIQAIEGFARGGNTKMGEIYDGEDVITYRSMLKQNEERQETVLKQVRANSKDQTVISKARDLLEALITQENQIKERMTYAAQYEYYRRIAGEVEARNVQTRDEMRARGEEPDRADYTQDVNSEQQIVLVYAPRKGDGFRAASAERAPGVREFFQTGDGPGREFFQGREDTRGGTILYHGTDIGNEKSIDRNGFLSGGALPSDAVFGGGRGDVGQIGISFSTEANNAGDFAISNSGKGVVYKARLSEDAKIVDSPVEYAEDLADKIEDLRSQGVDAVRIDQGEGEIVVINLDKIRIEGKKKYDGRGKLELFQTAGGSDLAGQRADKRGSIQFMQDRTVINLFKAANLSTFLHESGHLYLEVTKQVAERSSAPDQVKRDWQVVLDFIGAEQGKPITRDAHEKFAKAFETYLSEGRAPSEELRGVFERFKSWLLYVYRGASRAIGLPAIAPEIRDVFDRMLATDAELAEVGRAPEMRPLFADAAAAGMTQSQFDAYNRTVQAAADEARGSMLSRLLGEKRREQTREWRRQKEETRAEVFADLAARPVYQVQHYIRTGEILNSLEAAPTLDNRRLDRSWLVNKFGKDVLSRLPKQVPPIYTDKGGLHPDEVADWFGFDSGEHMVRELMSAPSFPRAVNARVDELMRERNGDLMSNQAELAQMATEAFNNDARGQYIEAELKALNGRANIRTGQASPRAQARAMARELIRGKRVAEAGRVGVFQRGAAKAAREAEAALAAGDFAAAADAKRRQLIQHALAQESAAARDEAETIRRYLDRFSSRKRPAGVDPDYLDQIEGILEGTDLRASTSLRKIERRKGLAAWMAEQEAEGASFVVPKELIEDAALKSYKDMTMNDFAAVRDIVKNIEHLGRLKNRLLEKGRLRSFQETRDTLVTQALKTPTRRQNKYRNPTKLERFQAGVFSVDAYLLKAEQIFDWLDMGDINGPFRRFIFNRFADAQSRKGEMMRDYAERVNTILAGKPKAYLAERLSVPARPELSFTRAEIYSIALNQGTESNRNKLLSGETVENLAGRSFRDETEMNSALSLLSKEDWDSVQAVWDTLESLWPETAALERRITGVEPPKLERREVATAHGTYRGGYYPMVYDPNESFDVEQRAAKDADALFDNKVYQRPAVSHGFTIARVENYSRPIKLDLGVLPAHLEASIHNITHREAVRDVLKLLSDKALSNAIDQTMGRPVLRELNQWLGRIAADRGVTSNDAVTNFILRARANISLYSMGWRLTTALSQLAGFSNSLELVKPYHMASALVSSTKNPRGTWEFVTSRSGEMRDRSNNLDRDVRLALRKLEDGDGPVQKFKRTAFFFTAMMDRVVTVPTWLGGYEQHLATYPGDEAGAIRAGDRAVTLTQGAGAAKDLSGILGNQSALSVFTLFYSYFNLFYNRLRTLGRDTRTMMADGSYEDLPHLIARSFALVILPALLADIIVGKWPSEEEDETWPWWAFKKAALYPLASVPLGRDIGSALDSGFDYQLSPLARPGDLTVKLIGDAGKAIRGEDVEGRLAAKRAAELGGYVLGLPLGQGVSTGSNIWQGLEQGDLKFLDLFFNRRAYGDERKQR